MSTNRFILCSFQRLILAMCAFSIFFAGCGQKISVEGETGLSLQLSWTTPSTNVDGSTIDDLAGFRLHYGSEQGVYSHVVNVGNLTTHVLRDLSPGPWYFSVTAYDIWQNESDFSNEIHYLASQ